MYIIYSNADWDSSQYYYGFITIFALTLVTLFLMNMADPWRVMGKRHYAGPHGLGGFCQLG